MKNRVDHRFDSMTENPSPELKSSDHCLLALVLLGVFTTAIGTTVVRRNRSLIVDVARL
jgi:hypothetical protein